MEQSGRGHSVPGHALGPYHAPKPILSWMPPNFLPTQTYSHVRSTSYLKLIKLFVTHAALLHCKRSMQSTLYNWHLVTILSPSEGSTCCKKTVLWWCNGTILWLVCKERLTLGLSVTNSGLLGWEVSSAQSYCGSSSSKMPSKSDFRFFKTDFGCKLNYIRSNEAMSNNWRLKI